MSLVLFVNGTARTLDKSALAVELPRLIESAGEDVEALTELLRVAVDHALYAAADDALLRIARVKGRDDVELARLSETVGRAILEERAPRKAGDVVSVPMLGTVWSSVLAENGPARDVLSFDKIPRVVFFAFAVDAEEQSALGAGPTTSAGKLSRAIPLAISERLTNVCAPVFVQPVVESAQGALPSALYVATAPWALPEMLMLSPLDEKPVMIVGGRVSAPDADGKRTVDVDVWSLRRGARRQLHGTLGDERGLAEIAGDISAMFGNVFPRRHGLTTFNVDVTYLEALADAHLALLLASKSVDASTARNVDDAERNMIKLAERAERDLASKLVVLAFAVAAKSAKLALSKAFVDVALKCAVDVEREIPELAAVLSTLRSR